MCLVERVQRYSKIRETQRVREELFKISMIVILSICFHGTFHSCPLCYLFSLFKVVFLLLMLSKDGVMVALLICWFVCLEWRHTKYITSHFNFFTGQIEIWLYYILPNIIKKLHIFVKAFYYYYKFMMMKSIETRVDVLILKLVVYLNLVNLSSEI